MELTLWTYEAPPHVGAMRIANSMPGLHYVLHAPQGDTYADLLFTMIERNGHRPPATYTTFQARDLGGDTAELFRTALKDAADRFKPQAMIVGSSCTAELIQDDPGGLAQTEGLGLPVFPLELPAYSKKENWGAAETFYQLVRGLADRDIPARDAGTAPSCNILGPSSLGFRARDNVREIVTLVESLGITVNLVAPLGCAPADLHAISHADFNINLYPEVANIAVKWLEREFGQKSTKTVPIGVGATNQFVREVLMLAGLIGEVIDKRAQTAASEARLPWYSRSVDSGYLTGKRVFIFGDGTHAPALSHVAKEEMGFDVVGLGTYSREMAKPIRARARDLGIEPLITDDYLAVEAAIKDSAPELVLGTQMERHVAKRLGIGCAVISAPVHVQDFPARTSPTMGYEGANVLFDTLIHPLVMGLEEHLLGMFREDFEFHDGAGASHLGHGAVTRPTSDDRPIEVTLPATDQTSQLAAVSPGTQNAITWAAEAQKELKKIPFFVRGKARRNTESYAKEHGLTEISLETLYDAKAHFSR